MTTTRAFHDPSVHPEIMSPSMLSKIPPRPTQLLFPPPKSSDPRLQRNSMASTMDGSTFDPRATGSNRYPFQHAQQYFSNANRVQDHASGQLLNYRTSSTAVGSEQRPKKIGNTTFPSSFTMGDPRTFNAGLYKSNTEASYQGKHGQASVPKPVAIPPPIRGDNNKFASQTQLMTSNTADYQLGRLNTSQPRRVSLPVVKNPILQDWAAEDLQTTQHDFSQPGSDEYVPPTNQSRVHRAVYGTNWADLPQSGNRMASQTQMRSDFPPLQPHYKRIPLGPDLTIKTQGGAPGLGLLRQLDPMTTTRSHFRHPGPPQRYQPDPKDREITFNGSGGPVSVGTTMSTSYIGQPGEPRQKHFYGHDNIPLDEGYPTVTHSEQLSATMNWRDAVTQQVNTSRYRNIKDTTFKHQSQPDTNYTSTSRDAFRGYS